MGQKDDLLVGAKRCLYEKGYGRTTARDITAASGANLAAIGYHFGSKEILLNTALIEAIGEWGDELAQAVTSSEDEGATPLERFERIWTRIIELFARHRHLMAASFEGFAQVERVAEVRLAYADAFSEARSGLALLFHHIDANEPSARAVGSFYQALLTGVVAQWLVDPDNAPSARDLTDALHIISEGKKQEKLV